MEKITNHVENEIKLYSLLVDELFRHQTNIWQIPTALISVNLVAIYNFQSQWVPLAVLCIFNAGLIFVFCQMVKAQMKIIDTIKKAEEKLKPTFLAFLPNIREPKIKSPYVFVGILLLLEIILAGYIIYIYLCSPCFYLLIKYSTACVLTSHST